MYTKKQIYKIYTQTRYKIDNNKWDFLSHILKYRYTKLEFLLYLLRFNIVDV